MKSQKEAVYSATMAVLGTMKIKFEAGQDIKALAQVKEVRDQVVAAVVDGFRKKEVKLESDFGDQDLVTYTKGMVNNWYRKDTRLNGGEKYTAKNPGSRAGTGNEEVRELKRLKAAQQAAGASAETLNLIQQAIDAKIASHRASKQPQPDLSKIDPAFLKQLGIKAS